MTIDDQALLTLTNPPAELSPELRKELMDLATGLRSAAAKIDVLTQRKARKQVDAAGDPTFAYAAKVCIPKEFYVTVKLWSYASDLGFKADEIKSMADAFVRYYNKTGTKWKDWSKVWMDWVLRERQRKIDTRSNLTSDKLKTW